jgi:hypothetical protein
LVPPPEAVFPVLQFLEPNILQKVAGILRAGQRKT